MQTEIVEASADSSPSGFININGTFIQVSNICVVSPPEAATQGTGYSVTVHTSGQASIKITHDTLKEANHFLDTLFKAINASRRV